MNRLARFILFYPAVALLWLGACVLGLELIGLLEQVWIERHNPLITAYKNNTPFPDECTTMHPSEIPVATEMPGDVELNLGDLFFSVDPSVQKVIDWGPRDVTLSWEEQQERRGQFPELSSLGREVYAQLNAELVITVDKEFHIDKVYGFYKILLTDAVCSFMEVMIRRTAVLEPLHNAILETLESGRTVVSTISLSDEEPLKFVCLTPDRARASSDEQAFVFFEFHPELIESKNLKNDDTTVWAVEGHCFKPNYHSESDPSLSTNAAGFYDTDVVIPKPENVFRIVCIGGSTTKEGGTVRDTYPKLLESHLRHTLPGCAIEVLNAGTPGNCANTHLLRFPEYLRLQPDLIILHIGVNDTMFHFYGPAVNSLPHVSHFVRSFFPSILAPSNPVFVQRHYMDMGIALELLIHLAQRNGIDVILSSIAYPDVEHITEDEHEYYEYNAQCSWQLPAFSLTDYVSYISISNEILKLLAQKHNLDFLAIDKHVRGGLPIFSDFCHMTQTGINLKAQTFHDLLLPVLGKYLVGGTSEARQGDCISAWPGVAQ